MAAIAPDIGLPQGAGSPQIETRAPDDYLQVDNKAGAALQQAGAQATDLSKVFGQVQVDDVTNDAISQARDLVSKYQGLSGEDALNSQASYQQQLQQIFNKGEGQLHSLDQVEQYQNVTRTYQDRFFGGAIESHAQDAQKQYVATTNAATKQNGLNLVAGSPTSDAAFQAGTNLVMSSTVKDMQAAGYANDPNLMKAATTEAMQGLWGSRIQALAVTDPTAALAMATQNQALLGDKFASLTDPIRQRADLQTGQQAGAAALNDTLPATVGGDITQPPVNNPGNLKVPGDPKAFQQFPTQQAGVQALNDQLLLDNRPVATGGHGLTTVSALINSWAPPSDNNDTGAYITNVSAAAGVDPNAPIDLHANPQLLSKISGAIIKQEGDSNNGAQPGATDYGATKAAAYQRILNDPNLSPEQRTHALDYINQSLTAQQIADQATQQQQVQANRVASNNYMTEMLTSVDHGGTLDPNILPKIAQDPNLDAGTKEGLFNTALRLSGKDTTIGYGSGYTSVYSQIVSGKITTPQQILAMSGPGGSLTVSGAQTALQTLSQMNKGPDEQSLEITRSGMLNYAKSRLSFQSDSDTPGMPGLKDPAGEAIYNSEFVPKFMAGYTAWVNAGKDPYQYMTKKNVDDMVASMRSPAQMAQDQIAAQNGLYGGNDQTQAQDSNPPPPPPTGVNVSGWDSLMTAPPSTAQGPIAKDVWGKALMLLQSDPKKYSGYFDQTFGPSGYTAATVLEQMQEAQNAAVQNQGFLGPRAGGGAQ